MVSVPKTKRRAYKKAPKSKISKSLTKEVMRISQRVLNKNTEDKRAWRNAAIANFNSGINSAADINELSPQISNATGPSSRIGDEIHAKTFRVRGHIVTNLSSVYNNYSSTRIGVRMMIVQPKAFGSSVDIITSFSWLNYLLVKGGTVSQFTGTTADLYSDINTDAITVYYDKTYYMTSPYIPGTNTGVINTSEMTKFFDIRLKTKNKRLKYDSSIDSGLTPINFNPVLLIGYCKLDGSAADTVNTQISLAYVSEMTFQDL